MNVFVQSVYFDLILAAANERLSVMSEQRYYLLRKEENDINKGSSGLELEILDEWTGKRRKCKNHYLEENHLKQHYLLH